MVNKIKSTFNRQNPSYRVTKSYAAYARKNCGTSIRATRSDKGTKRKKY
jgi:hypothetical protein